jgi:hypothetical protein
MRSIEKLKAKGIMSFEQKEHGKPRNVRLYNLRKYFRKEAGKAGIEYVNFWMGHKTDYQAPYIPASDVHYFPHEDVEFQRQLYAEKAMPHLRLETRTPDEREIEIVELRKQLEQRDKELAELRSQIKAVQDGGQELYAIVNKMQPFLDFANSFENKELLEDFLTQLKRETAVIIETPEGPHGYMDIPDATIDKLTELARKRGFRGTEREDTINYLMGRAKGRFRTVGVDQLMEIARALGFKGYDAGDAYEFIMKELKLEKKTKKT